MTKAMVVTILAAASMQAETMTAKIVFPFEASGQQMAAGTYEVTPVANLKYSIRNTATGKKIILMGFGIVTNASTVRQNPRLEFTCAGQRCALTEVWSERDGVANRQVREALGATAAPVMVSLNK